MCLWLKAQELNSSGLQRHHCAHENSPVIWSANLLAGLFHVSSLPAHQNTKHNLDNTTFSKTTLHTGHLFQNLCSRQAALMNRTRTSIARVAETRAAPLPQFMSPQSLRQFWKFSGRHLSIVDCAETIWRTRSTTSNY